MVGAKNHLRDFSLPEQEPPQKSAAPQHVLPSKNSTYGDIPPVGDEVTDLGDPELLDLGGEGQIVAEVGDLVLQQELQPLVELVVFTFHILEEKEK